MSNTELIRVRAVSPIYQGAHGEIAVAFDTAPAPGSVLEVVPGLFWTRMPMPVRPHFVAVFLMPEGDGWHVIDAGLNNEDVHAAWEALAAGHMAGRPVRQITMTHGHPDHIGYAGRLALQHGCPMAITLAEWQWARLSFYERALDNTAEMIADLVKNGLPMPEAKAVVQKRVSTRRSIMFEPPSAFYRLRHGDVVAMGGRQWRVVTGGGHALEHASFYCEADKVLIAGDQVLTDMSPGIGAPMSELVANPLHEYLESLGHFEAMDPETLVLPSHGVPFRGLHARVRQIRAHHDRKLATVGAAVRGRIQALEIARSVSPKAFPNQMRQAVNDVIGHLNLLVSRGELVRSIDEAGGIWYAPH